MNDNTKITLTFGQLKDVIESAVKIPATHYTVENLSHTGGTYSSGRYLSGLFERDDPLLEGISTLFPVNKRGGMITFSTEVNSEQLSKNIVVNYLRKLYKSIENRFTKDAKIDGILKKHGLGGWTVGHGLHGRYTSPSGKVFDESSSTLDLVGIDTNKLISVAEDLCTVFGQTEALVKDYSSGDVYLVRP